MRAGLSRGRRLLGEALTSMRRIAAWALLAMLAMVVVASRVQAQGADVPRIGVLLFVSATSAAQDALRQGLRDHGWVDGQNIVVEWRSAEGRAERAAPLAAELVRLGVRVIVTEFTLATVAARNATRTIPIVMAPAGDPVASGLVESLARPGGNVTGFSNIAAELSDKRLEFLREAVPNLSRLGMLIHGGDPLEKAFIDETRRAATKAGIQVVVANVPRADQLDAAIGRLASERVEGVVVLGNVPASPRRIGQQALRARLPTISLVPQFAEEGGLMSYGASLSDIHRRAASFVDRILKGARPGDLPVELPTKVELVINRGTATKLGLTLPPALLLRADRVVD